MNDLWLLAAYGSEVIKGKGLRSLASANLSTATRRVCNERIVATVGSLKKGGHACFYAEKLLAGRHTEVCIPFRKPALLGEQLGPASQHPCRPCLPSARCTVPPALGVEWRYSWAMTAQSLTENASGLPPESQMKPPRLFKRVCNSMRVCIY